MADAIEGVPTGIAGTHTQTPIFPESFARADATDEPASVQVELAAPPDAGMTAARFENTGTLPSNVHGVEICAFSGSNCSGAGSNGIFAGTSDTFPVPPSVNVPEPGPLPRATAAMHRPHERCAR